MRKLILFVAVMMVLLSSQNIQAQWNEVGGLNGLAANGPIKTMCSDPAGNIYAAGGFRNDSGKFYVAKWDGNSWSELGGMNGIKAYDTINSICSDAQGNIYAGLDYGVGGGGLPNVYVAKWNGNQWSFIYTGGSEYCCTINTLSCDIQGNVYAMGDFFQTMTGHFIAKWDGNNWSKIWFNHTGFPYYFYSSCSDHFGNIYIAGSYANSSFLALLNSGNINSFGPPPGHEHYGSEIFSICSDTSGNLYAGGIFTNGSNLNNGHYYVAKGNGTTWTELGGKDALAANHPIRSVFRDGLGRIFAAGDFTNSSGNNYVAKFDGISWRELGGNNSLAANNTIRTICTDTAGNIYLAGDFTNANGKQYVAVLSKSLGINETPTSSISISPNPTTSSITIKGITEPTIAVYNLMGEKVVDSKGSNEVNLAQLPAGMYLVQVFNKDMELVKSEKVIKE